MDCKLCLKKFSNGKALGAHMRSHYAILPLPPKTPQRQEVGQLLSESASSSIFYCDERENSEEKSLLSGTYGLRENPKKSFRLPDPDLFDVGSVESESGSTRARFKRSKGVNLDDDQEVTKNEFAGDPPVVAESELGMEEDVALCLIMLSRDVWRKSEHSNRTIYRCEKCDKVFKSSQGLGSHKASHFKKIKSEIVGEDQLHECALCLRNFKSAQALGGHKRSHLQQALKFGRNLVDLNMPAAAVES